MRQFLFRLVDVTGRIIQLHNDISKNSDKMNTEHMFRNKQYVSREQ
jgi:hypothetical protein